MAANLFNEFNVHEAVRARPSNWFVACFLLFLGPESKWDEPGENSKDVRNTVLMMECNDCLYVGWNEQTCTTDLERLPQNSEVETLMVQRTQISFGHGQHGHGSPGQDC